MLEQIINQTVSTEQKKGSMTKALIVQAALEIASNSGLEGITIGHLAERVNMSKSGVFAHFGSREELQVDVVREYTRRFESAVFLPALLKPKGLPRLLQMVSAWLKMSTGIGSLSCFFIAGAVEFDDRPGIVRNELKKSVDTWRAALLRAIKESVAEGHLKKTVNADQLLFQVYSTVLGAHHDCRFLENTESLAMANKLLKSIIASHQIKKPATKNNRIDP